MTMLKHSYGNSQGRSPSFNWFEQLRHTLAYFIGPIAGLVIEEVLEQNPDIITRDALIKAISKAIPESTRAEEFRKAAVSLLYA